MNGIGPSSIGGRRADTAVHYCLLFGKNLAYLRSTIGTRVIESQAKKSTLPLFCSGANLSSVKNESRPSSKPQKQNTIVADSTNEAILLL